MHSGFGKVILVGEHAVVHGHPALAGSLRRGVTCTAQEAPSGEGSTLFAPAWSLSVHSADQNPVAEALRRVLDGCGAAGRCFHFEVDADLPVAAGLGSSAALSVALTRSAAAALARTLDIEAIERIAGSAEECFHAKPSGIDVALACRGGVGLYRRGGGLAPIHCAPVSIVVGLSGEPRRTADMVAKVSAALTQNPAQTGKTLAALGEAAESGARALETNDLERLAEAMASAQEGLAVLGLSTPRIDELIRLAQTNGALAAKLTGAGGGGAVIALAPESETRVLGAWAAAGFEGFASEVGATNR
jgi:mevalonate kinase